MAKRWKSLYVTSGRNEIAFHATKEAAMSAMYARLDMAQRDAISLGETAVADAMGKARAEMASSWQSVVKGRTGHVAYNGGFFNITRNV